jgi:ferritin-like metal-binding protein YciE
MATHHDALTAWLRDAHAMENQAIKILEGQDERLEHYPELRAKVHEHLQQTRRQAEMLEDCLERLGEDRSAFKAGMGKLMGNMQAMSGLFVGDEVVKGALASYTFEQFEIASYKSLIAAAEEAGEAEVRGVCERILGEEEDMARWLGDHLPEVTRAYLMREAAGQPAKR